MRRRSRWKVIYISGWVITGFGILGVIWNSSIRLLDFSLLIAFAAIVFVGLFGSAIAQSLHVLEQRLDEMESRSRADAPKW